MLNCNLFDVIQLQVGLLRLRWDNPSDTNIGKYKLHEAVHSWVCSKVVVLPILIQHPVLRSVWVWAGYWFCFCRPPPSRSPPTDMQISQHSIYFSFNRLLADGSLMPDMKIDFNSNYNIKYYQTFQLTKGWLADGGEGLKIINEKTRLLIVGGGRHGRSC